MKRALVLILAMFLLITVVGCSKTTPETEKEVEVEDEVKEPIDEVVEDKDEIEEETSNEEIAESNAKEYPAGPGTILTTKGKHNFTGMDYYFKGELIGITTLETNVGDPNAWLIKNDKGYVMPIQHDSFEAAEGDKVEVWGTLTGDGYSSSSFEGVDNVVGETGSMHAISVSVNGTRQ